MSPHSNPVLDRPATAPTVDVRSGGAVLNDPSCWSTLHDELSGLLDRLEGSDDVALKRNASRVRRRLDEVRVSAEPTCAGDCAAVHGVVNAALRQVADAVPVSFTRPATDLLVRADEYQLTRALELLLATLSDGATRLVLEIEEQADSVLLNVRGDGAPVPVAACARIIGRFSALLGPDAPARLALGRDGLRVDGAALTGHSMTGDTGFTLRLPRVAG